MGRKLQGLLQLINVHRTYYFMDHIKIVFISEYVAATMAGALLTLLFICYCSTALSKLHHTQFVITELHGLTTRIIISLDVEVRIGECNVFINWCEICREDKTGKEAIQTFIPTYP
jgi:uncharacterized protein YebE (UPF0316 family)